VEIPRPDEPEEAEEPDEPVDEKEREEKALSAGWGAALISARNDQLCEFLGRSTHGVTSSLRLWGRLLIIPSISSDGLSVPIWLMVWNIWIISPHIYICIYNKYIHILGIIIPTDELIFFREVETTNKYLFYI
jgi:hypothetical protein